ncbi:MAG: phosphoribosylformylglycinamidine synthase I [Chloroflexia bacterium]|nr:phosphoribosylformylglycinamidine synthase I [Chloroflexia bacterium]
MKFGIIRFPESTGHNDMAYVLGEILEQEVIEIWYRESKLPKMDAIIIPGGTGGEKPRKNEPIVNEIIKFANNGGFVFGVGLGFRLLCEIELLPGKLLPNESGKFYCNNTFVKPKHTHSALTALLNTNLAYKIPVATKSGRFHSDDDTIKLMREKEQILFQYCTEDGQLSESANPNGSRANVAAVSNTGKNVYGMIPQPERAADDEIGNTDGTYIFDSILAYLK